MTHFHAAESLITHLRQHPVKHLIDGAMHGSPTSLSVVNPATGRACAEFPQATREQLDLAVASARRAQAGWGATPLRERSERLAQLAQLMREHCDELAGLVTLEQGKPLPRARDEIQRAAYQIERVIAIPFESSVLRDTPEGRIELYHRPLGVVGAITPWNMPIVLALPKMSHALYTGNTIVLKPSPYTPLATLRLAEIAQHVFPAGVVNILAGGDEFGRWMSEHVGLDKLSFTGSIATGKHVMASAARNLKRLTLELGGNDAAIVMPDAELATAIPKLFASAFANSGQVCMAIKRLYVHESVYDQVVDGLTVLASSASVGDGFEPGVQIGPLQNGVQHDAVLQIFEDVVARGGRFRCGGHALDRAGYFIAPSIVTDLPEDARLVGEEPFGPVLPVLKFSSVEDVLHRANNTRFGLGGSVWSSDISVAASMANRLEVGVAWVNSHMSLDACAPFGGIKESGIGREYGPQGLYEYTNAVAVYLPAQSPT